MADAFWLPRRIRDRFLSAAAGFETASFAHGQPCDPAAEGAVTVRWPVFGPDQFAGLMAALQAERHLAPAGPAFWERLKAALSVVAARLADPADALHRQALATLPGYTGYSRPMIELSLGAMELMALDDLPAALALPLVPIAAQARRGWQRLPGLPGRIRCYPEIGAGERPAGLIGRARDRLARRPAPGANAGGSGSPGGEATFPELVVGYGAGNVPGTALLIALLAQSITLAGDPPPAVLARNSRREPIFTPLVLSGLDAADPDLLSSVAVLIWDYEQPGIQEYVLSQADLVMAAAGDDTIAALRQALAGRPADRPVRFHAHGHKVSFSAISREVLARGLTEAQTGRPLIDVVALLAGLDSIYWDQNGCLSSRVHFVEAGDDGDFRPAEYAACLVEQLRLVGQFLPRGAWPRLSLYDRYDRYKLLETTGQVQVLSSYEDEFVVLVDERPWDSAVCRSTVNDCQGRVIVVRPVAGLMDVPRRHLPLLPAAGLQSLSVAVGRPGEALADSFLAFADACGACGVTAIRTVGRGAFPQLAYSWDGLIPADLIHRPVGRFTTIEFDAPFDQMLATYELFLRRGIALQAGTR